LPLVGFWCAALFFFLDALHLDSVLKSPFRHLWKIILQPFYHSRAATVKGAALRLYIAYIAYISLYIKMASFENIGKRKAPAAETSILSRKSLRKAGFLKSNFFSLGIQF
jgi:hypothetical protein